MKVVLELMESQDFILLALIVVNPALSAGVLHVGWLWFGS